MNKRELVNTIAGRTEQKKSAVAAMLDAILEAITEALKDGQEVRLRDFGRFYVKPYKAREIKSPNQAHTYVDEHLLPKFKAAKAFKEKLNSNE